MTVENLKIQISLSSSTFQGRQFQLKFRTQACNEVVYKTALGYRFLISYQKVLQMSLPPICKLRLIFAIIILKLKGLGKKTVAMFSNH